ncbi:MAG: Ig-like domain-containing protein [Candidatus Cloacimonetes bacterium]|nr:Ig-like domain-containing protein [Candidatus Cloacimonadota bacterium]
MKRPTNIFISLLMILIVAGCSFDNPYDPDNSIKLDNNLVLTRVSFNTVKVEWNTNSDVKTGYEIWRKDLTNSTQYELIADVPANSNSFLDSTLSNTNSLFTYKILGHSDDNYTNSVEKNYEHSKTIIQINQLEQISQTRIELTFSDNSQISRKYYLKRTLIEKNSELQKSKNWESSRDPESIRSFSKSDSIFIASFPDSIDTQTYTITNNIPGSYYRFSLHCISDYNEEISFSQDKAVTLLPVKELSAETEGDTVTLSWQNYIDPGITLQNYGYRIYIDNELENKITNWTTSEYVINDLTNGEHAIYLETFHQTNSVSSQPVNAFVSIAYPPVNVTAQFNSYSCTNLIQWEEGAEDVKRNTQYKIYRSQSSSDPGIHIGNSNGLNFSDNDLSNSSIFYYRVSAIIDENNETELSEAAYVNVELLIDFTVTIPDQYTWLENTPFQFNFNAETSNPYGLNLSLVELSLSENSPGEIQSTTDDTVTIIPDNGVTGTQNFVLELSYNNDFSLASHTFTASIENVNDAPYFTSIPITAATQNQLYTYNITTFDEDGDLLSITSASILPNWLTLTDHGDGTATLEGTPQSADIDVFQIGLVVRDSVLEDQQNFNITVLDANDPPYFEYNSTIFYSGATIDLTTEEDHAVSFLLTAHDIDSSTESFIWSYTDVLHGEVTIDVGRLHSETATITFTPEENFYGSDGAMFTIVVDDQQNRIQSEITFEMTISPVNDAPEFTSDPIISAYQDTPYVYNITTSDPDGDVLTITSEGTLPAWLTFSDNEDGTALLRGTPTSHDLGDYSISLSVRDGLLSNSQRFTLTVYEENDPISFVYNEHTYQNGDEINLSTPENELLSFNLTANDPNGDGTNFSWSVASVTNGTVIISDLREHTETKNISFEPDQDFSGTAEFSISVDDNQDRLISTLNFTVDVIHQNNAPYFTSTPVLNATQNEQYSYNITAEDPDGDIISITYSETLPEWLILTDNGDGSALLQGTPDSEDVGNHTVSLIVSDDSLEGIQTFSITVSGANEPISFVYNQTNYESGDEISISTTQNVPVTFNLRADDPNGDGTAFSWSAQDVTHGTITIDNTREHTETKRISFTPTTGYVGSAGFIIAVEDNQTRLVSTLIFIINVTSANNAPYFTSTPQTDANEGELYNYTITAEDPDNDEIAISSDNDLPEWLTLRDNGNGSAVLSGTPSSNHVGSSAITLVVSDGSLEGTQLFTLTVHDVNTSPYFEYNGTIYNHNSTIELSTDEDTTLSFMLTAHDNDDIDSFVWSYSNPNSGLVTIDVVREHSETARINFTPNSNYFGNGASFIINVNDQQDRLISSLNFRIGVQSVDDAPRVEGIQDQTIQMGETFDQFCLDDYLIEVDGDRVVWSAVDTANLLVTIDNRNVVTVRVIDPRWTGTDRIEFFVTDVTENQLSGSQNVSFTVLRLRQ